jgi:hypothetical protein
MQENKDQFTFLRPAYLYDSTYAKVKMPYYLDVIGINEDYLRICEQLPFNNSYEIMIPFEEFDGVVTTDINTGRIDEIFWIQFLIDDVNHQIDALKYHHNYYMKNGGENIKFITWLQESYSNFKSNKDNWKGEFELNKGKKEIDILTSLENNKILILNWIRDKQREDNTLYEMIQDEGQKSMRRKEDVLIPVTSVQPMEILTVPPKNPYKTIFVNGYAFQLFEKLRDEIQINPKYVFGDYSFIMRNMINDGYLLQTNHLKLIRFIDSTFGTDIEIKYDQFNIRSTDNKNKIYSRLKTEYEPKINSVL